MTFTYPVNKFSYAVGLKEMVSSNEFLRGKLSVKHYLQLASIAPAVSFHLNPTWSHHVIRRKVF